MTAGEWNFYAPRRPNSLTEAKKAARRSGGAFFAP
jgi:hypothetical protein